MNDTNQKPTHVIACADAWLRDAGQPTYSDLLAKLERSMTTTQPAGCDLDSLPPKPHTTYNGYSDGSEPLWTAEQMEDYARAAIAARAAQAPQGDTRQGAPEPVAAQFKMPGETWEECSIDEEESMRANGYKFRYLYATPAAHTCTPADERAPYSWNGVDGKQHDTGRITTVKGNYFATTGSPEDAKLVAEALNARAAQGAGTAPAESKQPIIGRLMDEISNLQMLWGLNEPGALLRNSDVFKVLVAVGKEYSSSTTHPAPVSTTAAPTMQVTAWLATDLDGRGDVGLTKEEAKRRAGEGCTEFIPLYDLPDVATVSTAAATERAAFDEKACRASCNVCFDEVGQEWPCARKLSRDRAARRSPVADAAGELPVLLEPTVLASDGYGFNPVLGYTAEQVRQAQRDAVAADRRSRVSADQWASLDAARVQLEAAKVERENRVARQSAPEGAPVGMVLVPVELPPAVVDAIAKASYDLDDTARTLVKEEWACALGMLKLHCAAPTSASAQPADQNKMENNDE